MCNSQEPGRKTARPRLRFAPAQMPGPTLGGARHTNARAQTASPCPLGRRAKQPNCLKRAMNWP
eukprot:11225489-Lingulodinium_polyedra.AAC.1